MNEAVAAADTAWILAAFTAVSLMVPGLAMFYGGMVSVRNTLNMAMMTFGAFAVVGVLWIVFGYSAVLGNSLAVSASWATPSSTSAPVHYWRPPPNPDCRPPWSPDSSCCSPASPSRSSPERWPTG